MIISMQSVSLGTCGIIIIVTHYHDNLVLCKHILTNIKNQKTLNKPSVFVCRIINTLSAWPTTARARYSNFFKRYSILFSSPLFCGRFSWAIDKYINYYGYGQPVSFRFGIMKLIVACLLMMMSFFDYISSHELFHIFSFEKTKY